MGQAKMFPQSKVEKILEEAADALTTATNKKAAADKAVKAATSVLLERMKKCRRRQMRVGNQIISIELQEKVKVVEVEEDDEKDEKHPTEEAVKKQKKDEEKKKDEKKEDAKADEKKEEVKV